MKLKCSNISRKKLRKSAEEMQAESWATFVGFWQPGSGPWDWDYWDWRFPELHVQNQIFQIGFKFVAATETRPAQWDTPPRFGPLLLQADIRCQIQTLILRQLLRLQTVECPRPGIIYATGEREETSDEVAASISNSVLIVVSCTRRKLHRSLGSHILVIKIF